MDQIDTGFTTDLQPLDDDAVVIGWQIDDAGGQHLESSSLAPLKALFWRGTNRHRGASRR